MFHTRRDLFRLAVTAPAGSLLTRCTAPESQAPERTAPEARKFTRPLGVQVYTLRRVLPEDPVAVLRGLVEIGYEEVELIHASYTPIAEAVTQAGLKPVSMHLDPALVVDPEGTPGLESVLEDVKTAGCRFALVPYLSADVRKAGLDRYRKLADLMNQAGEQCRDKGLNLAYHNHAFEFEPKEGSSPFETLVERTDPELVSLELDVFWTSVAGKDPVEVIQHHGDRISLLHLKDKAPGQPVQYHEKVPPENFREVGNGSLDFAAILQLAEQEGIEHLFVEQDETPGPPMDSLRQSYNYLRSLEL